MKSRSLQCYFCIPDWAVLSFHFKSLGSIHHYGINVTRLSTNLDYHTESGHLQASLWLCVLNFFIFFCPSTHHTTPPFKHWLVYVVPIIDMFSCLCFPPPSFLFLSMFLRTCASAALCWSSPCRSGPCRRCLPTLDRKAKGWVLPSSSKWGLFFLTFLLLMPHMERLW